MSLKNFQKSNFESTVIESGVYADLKSLEISYGASTWTGR